jgi:hypothetical protein
MTPRPWNIVALTRLSSAQWDAHRLSLDGTADRLGIIRREFERFHEVPAQRRQDKIRWALAKVAETERALSIEAGRMGEEEREAFYQKGLVSKLIKTVSYFFIIGATAEFLQKGGTYMSTALTLATAVVSGLLVRTAMDRLFGGTIESAKGNIGRALGECRDTLERL